jgi:MiaB/RimO family radical SAM methylthiotransferase
MAFDRAGTPEIQLTAQDVSAWGQDTGQSFPELLASVNSLPGQFMVRVGMMNPATVKNILDDLVKAFAGDHIFKFVHLPVQSGSDRVLERMARGYRIADFENIVAAFRKRYPNITLMTDMIVGYYGESPEDFSGSVELINRVKPNKVNVTRYSRRPFTPLFPEKDLPGSIKKDRSRVMNLSAEQVYASINNNKLGKRVPFVVTETLRKGSVFARSPEYLGVVINEHLPVGFRGQALLKKDRKYFFIGERVD